MARSFVLVKVAHLGNGVKEYCFEKPPTLAMVLKKAEVDRRNVKSITIDGKLIKKDDQRVNHNNVIVIVPAVRGG